MNLTGYIYDNNNNPVGATVLVLDAAGNPLTTAQVQPGQLYSIDYPENDLRTLTIVFSSQGFKSQTIPAAELLDTGSNIHFEKSNALLLLGIGVGLAYAFSKSKRKKVGALKSQDLTPILIIGGAFLAVNAISKILDKLGLGGNPASGALSDPNSAWGPNYWKQYTTFSYSISPNQADSFAQTIQNAFKVYEDDFNAIMGVFNQLKTKANVSYLSDIFTRKYAENLLAFLGNGGGILPWDGLSKEHMQQILSYVDKLPAH